MVQDVITDVKFDMMASGINILSSKKIIKMQNIKQHKELNPKS